MGSFSTAFSDDFDTLTATEEPPAGVQLRLGPHTLTVQRAAELPADYGDQTVPDWGNVQEHTVSGCSVQPAPAAENTVDRDTVITRWAVYAPPGADVTAVDRVLWSGATYEIDGEVLRWEFPPLSHLQFTLHRSEDT